MFVGAKLWHYFDTVDMFFVNIFRQFRGFF